MRFMPALLLLAACTAQPAATPEKTAAPPPEEAEILAAVNALTESWRTANPALADSVLHPEFRLTTLQGEAGDRQLYVVSRQDLVDAASGLEANDWDDRLRDIQVHIDPNGHATVWARYSFFVDGGQPSHCGNVAIELYEIDGAWKILNFADTHNNLNGRPEGEVCPD